MSLGRDRGVGNASGAPSQKATSSTVEVGQVDAVAKSADIETQAGSERFAEGGSGLNRERGGHMASNGLNGNAQMVRLCAQCCTFFEAGVGETYSMQRKSSVSTML
eukprot:g8156.t1